MNTTQSIRSFAAVTAFALLQIEPYRRDPTDDTPVPEAAD